MNDTNMSISSSLMSHVLTFRNELLFEASENYARPTYATLLGRMVVVEVGVALATVVAAIEGVIILCGLGAVEDQYGRPSPHMYNEMYRLRMYEQLTSCYFTTIWGLTNLFHLNFRVARLHTSEMENRTAISQALPYTLSLVIPPSRLLAQNPQYTIGLTSNISGSDFIWENIIYPADEESKNLFKEGDARIFQYTAAKAIFLYIFDDLFKNEQSSDFFKADTSKSIDELRKSIMEAGTEQSESIFKELSPIFTKVTSFDTATTDSMSEAAAKIFNEIRQASYSEIQGSRFITECFEKACSRLER